MSATPSENSTIESWLLEQYAKQNCDDPWSFKRYSACRILRDSGIPCYLWAEDALHYYGVPTAVFDIYIIVDDVKKAVDALSERGWKSPPPDYKPPYADIKGENYYLVEPQCKSVGHFNPVVALMAASDWNIRLPDISAQTRCHPQKTAKWPFIPPLHELLDLCIQKWLDTPSTYSPVCDRIGCFIGYLYGNIPILKLREFAAYMKVENRQYHFDVIAGVSYTRVPFRAHSQKVRDSIRRGDYEFRECSVSRDDERYFTAAAEARLLALLPPVNHA
ncbi:hypothetical protein FQN57_000554 [Myotisia sp. PD_48]|nr:hypothetical protein FQN57_000554 [Myotisia sp. PD_48]